jgi:hypothetical protein
MGVACVGIPISVRSASASAGFAENPAQPGAPRNLANRHTAGIYGLRRPDAKFHRRCDGHK